MRLHPHYVEARGAMTYVSGAQQLFARDSG
jgi:hypothetical protein